MRYRPRSGILLSIAALITSQALTPAKSDGILQLDKIGEVGMQAVAPSGPGAPASAPNDLLNSLSPKCQSLIQGLWLSDFARCINIIGLVPMITMDPRESILPSFINYANGLGGATCDPETLKTTRKQINQSCNAKDKEQTAILLVSNIIKNYGGLRKMLTVQPKSSSRPEDMCLGRMLKGAEAKSGQPFTRTKVEEILAGDLKGLVNYILKDTRKACSVCGTAVFDEGKKIAIRNGYTMRDLDSLEKTIDKKCPARDRDKSQLSLKGADPNSARHTHTTVVHSLIAAVFTVLLALVV